MSIGPQPRSELQRLEQKWRKPHEDFGSDFLCAADLARRACADELADVLTQEGAEWVSVGAIPETTEYANGWNACRQAVYAANHPAPAEPRAAEGAGTGDTDKAMAALDALSEIWAARVNVDHIAKAICGPPDRVERVKAMLKQAYLEGAYDGRTSHIDYPVSDPTAAAAVPAAFDADTLFSSFDADGNDITELVREGLRAPAPRGGVPEAWAIELAEQLERWVNSGTMCDGVLRANMRRWAKHLRATPPAAQAQDAGPMARHWRQAMKDEYNCNNHGCDVVEQRARALAAKEAK